MEISLDNFVVTMATSYDQDGNLSLIKPRQTQAIIFQIKGIVASTLHQ